GGGPAVAGRAVPTHGRAAAAARVRPGGRAGPTGRARSVLRFSGRLRRMPGDGGGRGPGPAVAHREGAGDEGRVIGDQVAAVLGGAVAGVTALGTGAGGAGTYRVSLLAGGNVFVKATGGQDPGFRASEASGLRWLREAESVPVPEVLGVSDSLLVTTWITPGRATREGAEDFGRQLATLHARGAHAYGAAWPGYIGALPLDNTEEEEWPGFYARRR